MATNLPSCFSIQFLEQLLKFLVNFTLLKYVKSQRRYGLLTTKELIFGFQILDLKDLFSTSLNTLFARIRHILTSKVFSDRNDHMETNCSFYQRSLTIAATANDRNDHDRWDRIRVYLCDRSDRERSSAIAKS